MVTTATQFEPFKDIERILIIQLGDIGDVVWTIPTFWAVREAYPEAMISVLLRKGIGGLIKEDPSVDAIFEVPQKEAGWIGGFLEQLRFIRTLRQARFDLVFDLRSGDRGAFTAFLTGAPYRASLYHTDVPFWRNGLFTHLLIPPPSPPPSGERTIFGAAEQSLHIMRGFGIATGSVTPRIWISETIRERVQEILRQEGMNGEKRWVSVNPFSRWSYKEWMDDRWVRLIDELWDEYRMAATIVGSASEGIRAEAIKKSCKGVVYNLAGKTTLSELAGILSLSRLHIGVDSAAPNIAAAVGVPTISIYGPSDWQEWAPVGDQHRVVASDRDCAPCRRKGCDNEGQSQCLENLDVETVQQVIREALAA